MVRKYVYGSPFDTEAVVAEVPLAEGPLPFGQIDLTEGFSFSYEMGGDEIIYGLGEANRGINKRGWRYVSWCSDMPNHTEDKPSLYGAHNFIIAAGTDRAFGLYFDYPSRLEFDIGYTDYDTLRVSCEDTNLTLYVIDGDSPYDIVRQFRKIIGRSYIPPKFAFGFGQSRWGYKSAEDIREVADRYREEHIPLDMIYLDIDYMESYKDFTVHPERFPDFAAFVREMKERHIRLVPIIDAGVKVEQGYPVYEEGVKKGYFCRKENGDYFTGVVWPGDVHFPNVLNPEARKWFGDWYKVLTDQGIEGFWNDMNEPAIFRSRDGVEALLEEVGHPGADQREQVLVCELPRKAGRLSNSMEDYRRFYHQIDGKAVRHDKVHNLYGYNMTRAAAEGLQRAAPGERKLLFSRSSYIGSHRYGGVWTGDNHSWWSHLLLNLKMLPSLNMCGYLYVGADLGGFGADTTRDLLLRWLALGVFTPLMRNHSAIGTRQQECWRFGDTADFRSIINVRYRLLPYLYSEYMKAALRDDLYFKPLAFVWPEDKLAAETEDQLLLGDEMMIAPVYQQNAKGRWVYLPEEMLLVKFLPDGGIYREVLEKGRHYVKAALNEVLLFIRKGRCIPVAQAAEYAEAVDASTLELLGWDGASYELYDDDGVHMDYDKREHWRMLRK